MEIRKLETLSSTKVLSAVSLTYHGPNNCKFCFLYSQIKPNNEERGKSVLFIFFSIRMPIFFFFFGKGVGSLHCIIFSLNLHRSPALLFLLNRTSSPDPDGRLPRVSPLKPGSRTPHCPSSSGKANSRREGHQGGGNLKAKEQGSTARTPSTHS